MDRRTGSSLIFLALLVAVVGGVLLLQAAVTGDGADGPAATESGRPAGLVDGEVATVVGISDGDTIRVLRADGRAERVRYIGIDAPELSHPEDGIAAECHGDAATRANEVLVTGRQVLLERDVSDRDRNGRLLRHVWVGAGDGGWQLVSRALVAGGHAIARSYPPDERRDGELATAEEAARAAGAGLWSAC